MKRASEVPPPVESEGRAPGDVLDRGGDEIGERTGLGEKGDRVGRLEGQRRALRPDRRGDSPLDLGAKRFGRPEIVEADVER